MWKLETIPNTGATNLVHKIDESTYLSKCEFFFGASFPFSEIAHNLLPIVLPELTLNHVREKKQQARGNSSSSGSSA